MEGERGDSLRFHKTPSDWDYEPLSLTETREFIEMLQLEGLANVSPCEPCEGWLRRRAPPWSTDVRRGGVDRMKPRPPLAT